MEKNTLVSFSDDLGMSRLGVVEEVRESQALVQDSLYSARWLAITELTELGRVTWKKEKSEKGAPSRHKRVEGEALIAQRQRLVDLAASLPYKLDVGCDLPRGAGAALSRLLGLRAEEVPRFWRGERAFVESVK